MNNIYINENKKIVKSILYKLSRENIVPVVIVESKKHKTSLISMVLKNNLKSIATLKTMHNKTYYKLNIDFQWNPINDDFIRVIFFKK